MTLQPINSKKCLPKVASLGSILHLTLMILFATRQMEKNVLLILQAGFEKASIRHWTGIFLVSSLANSANSANSANFDNSANSANFDNSANFHNFDICSYVSSVYGRGLPQLKITVDVIVVYSRNVFVLVLIKLLEK